MDGWSIGSLLRSQVVGDFDAGSLVEVLAEWLTDLPGFSLYYPSQRRTSPAFQAIIELFKETGKVNTSVN